jgi:GNAT superfamily N-acetyltransferase
VEDTLTVHVPDERRRDLAEIAMTGLSATEAVSVDVLGSRLMITAAIGPSSLFYAMDGVDRHGEAGEVVEDDVLADLRDSVSKEELNESGLSDLRGIVSVRRSRSGEIASACGWINWPFDIAHLCVLTHPRHRGRGFAKMVGTDAINRAETAGLIPQWRARVPASKAVARGIGMTELGTQLRISVPSS